MENLVKLFHDWEIQLLLLLSFTIQIFLFFTGGLRRRSTNILVRLSIWIAYLGADTVAVYALGYLSRQGDGHTLAFFWAPFLLVHLGGQDTITAFAMEDNNLWLRHLLNLVVQAALAVYVFWKSVGRHNLGLLVSGAFVFVAGVIKYGERIWSLRCARLESLEDSPGDQYKQPLQRASIGDQAADDYRNTVLDALFQMPRVFSIFVSRELFFIKQGSSYSIDLLTHWLHLVKAQRLKMLEICLGIMYDDLYTKASGLRTLRGILFRCISQICALVAFIVFVACDRRRYGRVETTITYSLFIGCLFLEVCGWIRLMSSPWTWAWLKALELKVKVDGFIWFLLSNDLTGWSKKRPLWSTAMGQFNFYGLWLAGSDSSEQHKPRSFSQRCMTVVRKLATLLNLEEEKLFFISKLLDREHVKVDGLLECLLDGVHRFLVSGPTNLTDVIGEPRFLDDGFGSTILRMHVLTEQFLCKYARPELDVEGNKAAAHNLVEECRKLSRYMVYLLVACPSLLPLEHSSLALLEQWLRKETQLSLLWHSIKAEQLASRVQQAGKETQTLEEIKEVWIRLIIYAASKSPPEQHAVLLARGGELLTFVWLHLRLNMYRSPLGIELTNKPSNNMCTFLHI